MLMVSMIYEIWVQQALHLSEPVRSRALRIADRFTSAAGRCWRGFRERQRRSAHRREWKNLSSTDLLEQGRWRNLGGVRVMACRGSKRP